MQKTCTAWVQWGSHFLKHFATIDDIIAEQAELLPLLHRKQETGMALRLDGKLQSSRVSTWAHTADSWRTRSRERTCSQTAHICYWLAEKQRAETIVTHCGDAVWRPERAKWNSSSIPQQKVWHKRFILQTAKIFEPITGGKWICLWRIKIWSTYKPHSKLHLWILTLNPWIYNHAWGEGETLCI